MPTPGTPTEEEQKAKRIEGLTRAIAAVSEELKSVDFKLKAVAGGTIAFGVATWGIGAVVAAGFFGAGSYKTQRAEIVTRRDRLIVDLKKEQGYFDDEYTFLKLPTKDETLDGTKQLVSTVKDVAQTGVNVVGGLVKKDEHHQTTSSPSP